MKVKVGDYLPDGTFEGEEVTFEGREVGTWRGWGDPVDARDQFVAELTLYECPDGYRVHEVVRSLSPDQPSSASLYPVVGHLGYGTYTEEEVRAKWGAHFEGFG